MDVAIINLRESRQYHELGTGSLYVKLQRKLPEMMLASYHRWIFENKHLESVETLRDWIVQEAEFQTIAAETIKGITTNPKKKRHNNGSFFSDQKSSNFRRCKVCNGKHGVWVCEVFHRMDVSNKWDAVKKEKLCFCCLGDDLRIAKEEENVGYQILSRNITNCYISRRRMIQKKVLEMEQVDKMAIIQTR